MLSRVDFPAPEGPVAVMNGAIPVAVNAPREARPDWVDTPCAELLAALRLRAQEFDAAFAPLFLGHPSGSTALQAMRRLGRAVTAPTLGLRNRS